MGRRLVFHLGPGSRLCVDVWLSSRLCQAFCIDSVSFLINKTSFKLCVDDSVVTHRYIMLTSEEIFALSYLKNLKL